MNRRFWVDLGAERLRPSPFMIGLSLVALLSVAGAVAPPHVNHTHIALAYLLAVLVMAVRFGLWPALATAVVSVGVLDFLFTEPRYSFYIAAPEDLLLVTFFIIVAIIGSTLASRLRQQMLIARGNAETTTELYHFAEQLAATLTIDAAVAAIVAQVAKMLDCRATVSLGSEASTRPTGLWIPLRSAGETIGLMTILPTDGGAISDRDRRLLGALAELAGIAIGRQQLADRLARLGIEQEADRLRSALLNSIAHDLTAPISSVATALTTLKAGYPDLDDAARREIIGEAEREADRLHRFSSNLVHMTRIETGAIRLRRERIEVGDLVSSALRRARGILAPRRIVVEIAAALPWPELDFALMEQVVYNLLDNATKYTLPDATVTISAELVATGIALRIADSGPGIPAEDCEQIFSKFYRGTSLSGGTNGTGLGLTICRGFVEAHGGTITAKNRPGGGAVFTIVLPVAFDNRN
jgi:two-component system sensor histidine kinase KdpD